MKLQDLENIKDYYIDEGFLCIKLISGDHLRINFNSIEAIKKQFSIPDVSHQRELLIAYELNVFKGKEQCSQEMAEEMVDKYLSNL
jgi:hypothetical protein